MSANWKLKVTWGLCPGLNLCSLYTHISISSSDIPSMSLECNSSASLRQETSEQYDTMLLEAGTRDIRSNISLPPDPPQFYLGGVAGNYTIE